MLAWAESGLAQRPGTLLISARYVPGGRIAVNVMAGALGFADARFLPWSAVSGTLWAIYTVTIGYLAGRWFEDNPLLGMVVAIVIGVLLGWLLDIAVSRIRSALARRK